MNVSEFRSAYAQSEKVRIICSHLESHCPKISLQGLAGSAKTVIADAVIQQLGGNHLFILPDKEEAAFFYNDLQNLEHLNQGILFFPHSYKRPYQLEETDNANVVSRAEVLERINRNAAAIIVTYPEALSEKVITNPKLIRSWHWMDIPD